VTPMLYEVRSAAGTLYVPGIGAAVDAARRLSDAHDRAEVHSGGVLIAVFVRGAEMSPGARLVEAALAKDAANESR